MSLMILVVMVTGTYGYNGCIITVKPNLMSQVCTVELMLQ